MTRTRTEGKGEKGERKEGATFEKTESFTLEK